MTTHLTRATVENLGRFIDRTLDDPPFDRATAFVCRKYGVARADREAFASAVRIEPIENEYTVPRTFENKCSRSAYLTIVIPPHSVDHKIQEWCKMALSMRARRGGRAAFHLDRLISRSGLGIGEASTIVRQK